MLNFTVREVTPAAAAAVTIAEVKDAARVDHTADDAFIAGVILAATEQIEKLTGRALVQRQVDMLADGFPGGSVMTLPRYPIVSVDSLSYRDVAGGTSSISLGSLRLSNSVPARLQLPGGWPSTDDLLDAVTIRATIGGPAEDVPTDLRLAVVLLATHWYENREASTDKEQRDIAYGVDRLIAPHRATWL